MYFSWSYSYMYLKKNHISVHSSLLPIHSYQKKRAHVNIANTNHHCNAESKLLLRRWPLELFDLFTIERLHRAAMRIRDKHLCNNKPDILGTNNGAVKQSFSTYANWGIKCKRFIYIYNSPGFTPWFKLLIANTNSTDNLTCHTWNPNLHAAF